MKQIQLRLVPAPGQKPEFLATLESTQETPLWQSSAVTHIVLENYTREAWALDTATKWHTLQLQSVDGRNKLPGFVNHLRERKKTAYGRFGTTQVIVVPPNQMSSKTLTCRIASIENLPPQCPIQSPPKKTATATATANNIPKKPVTATTKTLPPAKTKKKGMGLLGNLVGAQERTNQQVITAATKPKPKTSSAQQQQSFDDPNNNNNNDSSNTDPPSESKTGGQVLMDFREEMEQKMLDFDIAPEVQLKVKLDLAGKIRLLAEDEKQSGKVTMEVLKYIVYEAAEEVNEEWIAHKEPSEFVDEVVIVIYKEGEAPPEVIEDINKAELPEEVLGQQRALAQQQQRMQASKATKELKQKQKLAMSQQQQQQGSNDHEFAVLNTKKRDRRTIEEIQLKMKDGKRQRSG
jgi:hypothetical protein